MMNIHIRDLEFEAIIGILDFERQKEQKIIINIDIEYRYNKESFIDYAKVAQIIEETTKQEQFLLLEDAIEFLASHIYATFPQTKALELSITKPEILKNCLVGVSKKFNF